MQRQRLDKDIPKVSAALPSPKLTTNSYTQVRYKGSKYLIHRLTYRWLVERQLETGKEISHTMYLGKIRTARNINPNQLTEESGSRNQTRKSCHMYIETVFRDWTQDNWGEYGIVKPATKEELWQYISSTNGACQRLHHQLLCYADYGLWRQEFDLGNTAQPSSLGFETEDEAVIRLSSDE